jgi:hypothetical protein
VVSLFASFFFRRREPTPKKKKKKKKKKRDELKDLPIISEGKHFKLDEPSQSF